MSFGWSAGDIAQAISLIVKVARALDSVDGAASDYREAVSFLASLRRTLEPLQTLSALRIHPSYSVEIQQVVGKIKDPIEQFLAITEGFEPALGPNPQPGRQYNVGRKLQWRFVTSKRVIELRRNIEAYIGILNNLLHQVTIDTVVSLQTNLRSDLQRTLKEVVDPRLVSVLQEQLQPVVLNLAGHQQQTTEQYSSIVTKLETHHTELQQLRAAQSELSTYSQSLALQHEKTMARLHEQDLSHTTAIDTVNRHILSAVQNLREEPRKLCLESPVRTRRKIDHLNQPLSVLRMAAENGQIEDISLEELYYSILIYIGYFLRNFFFIILSRVRPQPALTPRPIPKFNISFHDAVGSPPRVLDYDCFISYKVFKAFLEDLFSSTLEGKYVEQGLYKLTDAKSNALITAESWPRLVVPGSHVVMSVIIHQFSTKRKCPRIQCRGTIGGEGRSLWKPCTKCGIEATTGLLEEVKRVQKLSLHVKADLNETTPQKATEKMQNLESDITPIIRHSIPTSRSLRLGVQMIELKARHFKHVEYISFLETLDTMRQVLAKVQILRASGWTWEVLYQEFV